MLEDEDCKSSFSFFSRRSCDLFVVLVFVCRLIEDAMNLFAIKAVLESSCCKLRNQKAASFRAFFPLWNWLSAVRGLQVLFLVSCLILMFWVLGCFLEALCLELVDAYMPLHCRTLVGSWGTRLLSPCAFGSWNLHKVFNFVLNLLECILVSCWSYARV